MQRNRGALFSNSLIQFSVDGRGCVPSFLSDLRANHGGGMKIVATSFKRPFACMQCCTQCPDPAAGRRLPTPPQRLLDTPRRVWVGLSWGRCSFLLGPGAQGSVCALPESVSQSWVSSGSCMLGLMATSSQRAYATPRSAAPRAPAPVAGHC